MRTLSWSVVILVILLGCRPYPRYRAGEAKNPDIEESSDENKFQRKRAFDKSKTTATRDLMRLGRIIQSYLGTPYEWKSGHDEGLDCSQFVRIVFDEFNRSKLPRMVKKQFETGSRVARLELRYGDLVFFRTEGRSVSHVGIYIGDDEFAHATSSSGVIISSLKDDYWKDRFVAGRRILL